MTEEEWVHVASHIYASWPLTDWNAATMAAFFEHLYRFDVKDVFDGVRHLAEQSNYPPTIMQAVGAARAARVERESRQNAETRRLMAPVATRNAMLDGLRGWWDVRKGMGDDDSDISERARDLFGDKIVDELLENK